MEEFSCDAKQDAGGSRYGRATCNEKEINLYESVGIPWMYWSVVGISNDLREVFIDDPTWKIFEAHSKGTNRPGKFTWPELY